MPRVPRGMGLGFKVARSRTLIAFGVVIRIESLAGRREEIDGYFARDVICRFYLARGQAARKNGDRHGVASCLLCAVENKSIRGEEATQPGGTERDGTWLLVLSIRDFLVSL